MTPAARPAPRRSSGRFRWSSSSAPAAAARTRCGSCSSRFRTPLSTHEGAGTVRAGPAALLGENGCAWAACSEFNAYLYHHAGEDVFRRTFDPDPALRALMDEQLRGPREVDRVVRGERSRVLRCQRVRLQFHQLPARKAPAAPDSSISCATAMRAFARGRGAPRRRIPTRFPTRCPDRPWLLAKPAPFRPIAVHASWSGSRSRAEDLLVLEHG